MRPFHYAFKVKDIASTRNFYVDILGCKEGRSTESWIDFDLYGHQLSAHVSEDIPHLDYCGLVDGVSVPIPHFGCVLTQKQYSDVVANMEKAKIQFVLSPQTRYKGKAEEQQTVFVLDYSNNPLEFKSFKDESKIF